jgi:hypothetical protein
MVQVHIVQTLNASVGWYMSTQQADIDPALLSASCGRSFEIGTEYIVFTETQGAPWSVNSCSGTTQSTSDRTRDAAIAVYGWTRTPDPQMSVGIDDAGKSVWWAIDGIGGAIALVIGLILWGMRLPKH